MVALAALVFATSIVAGALFAAPVASAPRAVVPTTTVRTTLTDHAVVPKVATAPAGRVRFVAKNVGRIEHEIVVVKTVIPAGELPVNRKTRRAVVDGTTAVPMGALRKVKAGATKRGTFDLTSGHYVLICNIAGHYTGGMTVDFDVT